MARPGRKPNGRVGLNNGPSLALANGPGVDPVQRHIWNVRLRGCSGVAHCDSWEWRFGPAHSRLYITELL